MPDVFGDEPFVPCRAEVLVIGVLGGIFNAALSDVGAGDVASSETSDDMATA